LKRAASGNDKAERGVSVALAGATTTAEQFRVLATTLEGAAQAGSGNTEYADALLRTSRNLVDMLQNMIASATALTTLSARLAVTAEELGNEKQLD
jgi:hypothetical protein